MNLPKFKEFQLLIQDKNLLRNPHLISQHQKVNSFVNSQGQTINSGFIDTFYNIHYKQLDDIYSIYNYYQFLVEFRTDLPDNWREILFSNKYYSEKEKANYFLLYNDISLENLTMLSRWISEFRLFQILHLKPSYNCIKNVPSKEIYFQHFLTSLILKHIREAPYILGENKNTLSDLELGLIKEHGVLTNLDSLQIVNTWWTHKLEVAQRHLKKDLKDDYDNYKSIYDNLLKKYQII